MAFPGPTRRTVLFGLGPPGAITQVSCSSLFGRCLSLISTSEPLGNTSFVKPGIRAQFRSYRPLVPTIRPARCLFPSQPYFFRSIRLSNPRASVAIVRRVGRERYGLGLTPTSQAWRGLSQAHTETSVLHRTIALPSARR